jgi:hypothetical protein
MAITDGNIGSISKDIQAGVWNAANGEQDATWNLVKSYLDTFGRAPSVVEFNAALPAYDQGTTNGNAYIAQLYQNEQNSPDNVYKRQQDKYAKEAPEHYDAVNQLYQDQFGHDASQDEKDHFAKLLASGEADTYTIKQYLSQLPEAVKKEDEQFRNSLRDTISTQDSRYFNEQILPGIQKNFAQSGRNFESSAFTNAATQAAQQQNTGREDFLSNISASQYQGNKANAYNEYLNGVGRSQSLNDYNMQRTNQLIDADRARMYDIQNFNVQKQSYDAYLQRYGKRAGGNMFAGAASGAASGAMAGTAVLPGWGTAIGGVLGAGLGAFGASQQR